MLTSVNKIHPAVKQAGYYLKQLLMAPGVRSFSSASASYQRRKFRACGKQARVVLRIALSARERAVDFETGHRRDCPSPKKGRYNKELL
jgi:hypothetical protein